jgi:hypothetical protein
MRQGRTASIVFHDGHPGAKALVHDRFRVSVHLMMASSQRGKTIVGFSVTLHGKRRMPPRFRGRPAPGSGLLHLDFVNTMVGVRLLKFT